MKDRFELLCHWLRNDLGFQDFTITPASEDASFRRYFRVKFNGESQILMDAPPDKEDCGPFIDVSQRLLDCGVNVPTIRQQDKDKGFLLLDDLGEVLYLDVLTGDRVDQLYKDATETLLRMQCLAKVKGMPVFDEAHLTREMALFKDWLLGDYLGLVLGDEDAHMLDDTFKLLIESALEQPTVFVHRDYHSRNLMFRETNNPGVIDFQDAVRGPVTYDLVSLYKDCYIKWPTEKIESWTNEYHLAANTALDLNVGAEQFMGWFDLMGVQRHLKASGIFARLYCRDGKEGFLKDVPRALSYIVDLKQNYPELIGLIGLIEDHVLPALKEKQNP